ncbi:hypothetical protein HQ585_18370 [candidate division KSB1 bacterium]|nr:hypothetical protein [candidate division KSB1 bacterium]
MSGFNKIKGFFTQPESPRSSMISLIIVNLFPIYGIIFWGWQIFPIMFLFWSENVVVGFYNILRMIAFKSEEGVTWVTKLFMIPFFIFHYGMFTAVHGVFVIALFGQGLFDDVDPVSQNIFYPIISNPYMQLAVLALFLSHGYSFFANYIRKGEYKTTTLQQLMSRPYKRIVILHVTLIVGGFLVMALQSPIAGLLLFILLKTIIDLIAHQREHRKK